MPQILFADEESKALEAVDTLGLKRLCWSVSLMETYRPATLLEAAPGTSG